MQAALVRGHGKHAVPLAEFRQAFRKQIFQLRKQIGFDTAHGAVKAHAVNSTFFSPGASRYKMSSASRYALAAIAEEDGIAMRQLQDVACEEGKNCATD